MSIGGTSYLPLRVNTAGVMPVIFASSLLVVPQALSLFQTGEFLHVLATGGAVAFFSFFWTYLFFPPGEIALQLRESGSFIPGIRPGETTALHLNRILSRITACGAAFLCGITLLPALLTRAAGLGDALDGFLAGSGMLIVVGVALDLAQKLESHLLLRHYEGFLGPGSRLRGRK